MRPRLIYLHTLPRRWLVPFYSWYEILYFFVLEAVLYFLSAWIVPRFILEVLVFGYLGWVLGASERAPARLLLPEEAHDALLRELMRRGFVQRDGMWIPAFPRFLRWPHNRLAVNRYRRNLQVDGPSSYVKMLQTALSE
jgi:hypothetical protein